MKKIERKSNQKNNVVKGKKTTSKKSINVDNLTPFIG
jgi:hypothetical protein